ncbi:MAG: hypothetical protein LBH60_05330 [Prevotellaceae bacterium]|jgi:hypothetical protein|nr:hypothetical protein [Prevotellaceae bacterium]
MANDLFPLTIAGFTEYIKIVYVKAQNNLSVYGISPDKFAVITPLYETYIEKEAIAANPETATTAARRARNDSRKSLEPAWRKFINENIRFNSAVPPEDLEVFGVKQRDTTPTKVGVPDVVPALSIKQVGVRRYELEVLDSITGKKKKPQYAAGSYIYLAVTEAGKSPEHEDEYRKLDFSSNCHHVLEFTLEYLAQQANVYARYSNVHGKEGPKGSSETIIIG